MVGKESEVALPPLSGLVSVNSGVAGAGRVRREEVEGDRAGRVEAAGHRRRVGDGGADRPPAEGVVAMVGVAGVMVTGSSAQPG